MKAPPFPRPAIYVDEIHELRRFPIPFNFGQTGTAFFDKRHPNLLIFTPDGPPNLGRYVHPLNLYFPEP